MRLPNKAHPSLKSHQHADQRAASRHRRFNKPNAHRWRREQRDNGRVWQRPAAAGANGAGPLSWALFVNKQAVYAKGPLETF